MAEDLKVLEDKIIELEEKINELNSGENDDPNLEEKLLELQSKVDELELEKSQLAFERDQQEIMEKYGLPDDYKEYLIGESYEELEAKAKKLSELLSSKSSKTQENEQKTGGDEQESETNENGNSEWFSVPGFHTSSHGRDFVMEMEKGKNVFDDVLDYVFNPKK